MGASGRERPEIRPPCPCDIWGNTNGPQRPWAGAATTRFIAHLPPTSRPGRRPQHLLTGKPRRCGCQAKGRSAGGRGRVPGTQGDRKSTRLNSSHVKISYAVFCLKKKIKKVMS